MTEAITTRESIKLDLNRILLVELGKKFSEENIFDVNTADDPNNPARALDSAQNGIVLGKDLPVLPSRSEIKYEICEIVYGDCHPNLQCLNFKEYLQLGRPKSIRVTTTRKIGAV